MRVEIPETVSHQRLLDALMAHTLKSTDADEFVDCVDLAQALAMLQRQAEHEQLMHQEHAFRRKDTLSGRVAKVIKRFLC